jgi:hypothetical protein
MLPATLVRGTRYVKHNDYEHWSLAGPT